MKLKTNSIFCSAILMSMLCQSVVIGMETTKQLKVAYTLVVDHAKHFMTLKKKLRKSEDDSLAPSTDRAPSACVKAHELFKESLSRLTPPQETLHAPPPLMIMLENNWHELPLLINNNEILAKDLGQQLKFSVNGIEIPLGTQKTIPVIGNSCMITLSIPQGKVSKASSLHAAISKEPMSILKALFMKALDNLRYIFQYSYKIDKENLFIQDDGMPLLRISDIYASQPAFRDNFNPITLFNESLKIRYQWSDYDLYFELPSVQH